MSAARKSSSTEREADAPKPGQRTSGWRQSRCSLDSHYLTNHTLTVREGVITQSRAKSPGASPTSTLSLCLIEQFNVMLGTVPRHSIRYHPLSSTFSLSSARRFPNGLTHRAEGTPNSHILFLDEMALSLEPKWLKPHNKAARDSHSSHRQKRSVMCENDGCLHTRSGRIPRSVWNDPSEAAGASGRVRQMRITSCIDKNKRHQERGAHHRKATAGQVMWIPRQWLPLRSSTCQEGNHNSHSFPRREPDTAGALSHDPENPRRRRGYAVTRQEDQRVEARERCVLDAFATL